MDKEGGMRMAMNASMARLPKYLAYLKIRQKQGEATISSTKIAEDLHLNPVQVRKDLAMASHAGRPKTGYPLGTLIDDLERFLGFSNVSEAFLVGAGRLGRALLYYDQFAELGLSILAAFDTDPTVQGFELAGKPVFPLEKLPDLARRMQMRIGILTVPTVAAQEVAELMVAGGIRAIWNFTSAHLTVPEGIVVQNESMAASFAMLSNKLSALLRNEAQEGGTP